MKEIFALFLVLIMIPAALGEALPVYEAIQQDFTQRVQPEWFNGSGISGRIQNHWAFSDGASLHCSPETVNYEGPSPMAYRLISLVGLYGENCPLECMELACISLTQAQKTLEELLSQIGVAGYVCEAALDMSAHRVRELAARQQKDLDSGKLFSNLPPMDLSRLTPEQEGYYLCYRLPGTTSPVDYFSAYAFVTCRGVEYLMLRDPYRKGAVIGQITPVAPETVLANLKKAASPERVTHLGLTYGLTEVEGVQVFSPVYRALYKDAKALSQGYDCWALFSAEDGTLIDAIFK